MWIFISAGMLQRFAGFGIILHWAVVSTEVIGRRKAFNDKGLRKNRIPGQWG